MDSSVYLKDTQVVCRVCLPWRESQDISALHLSAPQEHLVQDLILEQLHGSPPLSHIPPLLDGVGHVPIPPAVVLQSPMPAFTAHALLLGSRVSKHAFSRCALESLPPCQTGF